MLRKFVALTIAGAAALTMPSPASADLGTALSNICEIVKTNDKGELRKKMRNVRNDYDMQLRDYYSGITCGGKSLIKLAIVNEAVDAGTLLVKKMPKKLLNEPEHDGEALTAWISANGHENNAVALVLKERL